MKRIFFSYRDFTVHSEKRIVHSEPRLHKVKRIVQIMLFFQSEQLQIITTSTDGQQNSPRLHWCWFTSRCPFPNAHMWMHPAIVTFQNQSSSFRHHARYFTGLSMATYATPHMAAKAPCLTELEACANNTPMYINVPITQSPQTCLHNMQKYINILDHKYVTSAQLTYCNDKLYQ